MDERHSPREPWPERYIHSIIGQPSPRRYWDYLRASYSLRTKQYIEAYTTIRSSISG